MPSGIEARKAVGRERGCKLAGAGGLRQFVSTTGHRERRLVLVTYPDPQRDRRRLRPELPLSPSDGMAHELRSIRSARAAGEMTTRPHLGREGA